MTLNGSMQATDPQIDTFSRTFNALLASRKSRLEMTDPQMSTLIHSDLDALESTIA
jgi:hypothetical protein